MLHFPRRCGRRPGREPAFGKPTADNAGGREQGKAFLEIGVPEEWIEPLIALGYDSVEKLKEVEKPGKLHQEMMGYRKKNKLDLPGLSPEAVAEWLQ
ncbi:MAG: hypothetical protein ACQERS_14515 [Bacteroidota bacterium]